MPWSLADAVPIPAFLESITNGAVLSHTDRCLAVGELSCIKVSQRPKQMNKTKAIKIMKRQFRFSSIILQYGTRLFIGCLLGSGVMLSVQKSQCAITTPGGDNGPGNTIMVTGSGGGSGQAGFSSINVNGSDIGSVILKTCDLNHDGTVSLAELKEVAAGCFKLWDTNNDGYLNQNELSAAFKQFFPAPVGGGFRVVNGVASQVSPDEMPTPDKQLAKHIMAGADSNKDGLISLQELNDFLDKSFSQWDQDGNGSLNAQELSMAFAQLARPD